jgi:hypothetical protein
VPPLPSPFRHPGERRDPRRIAVIGQVDGLLEGVGFNLGGVVDVGVDAGEDGDLRLGTLPLGAACRNARGRATHPE